MYYISVPTHSQALAEKCENPTVHLLGEVDAALVRLRVLGRIPEPLDRARLRNRIGISAIASASFSGSTYAGRGAGGAKVGHGDGECG